ncbi:MAG: hypothetical protein ACD_22C00256G0007 [uncultured bacterium]|uniref:DUF4238 domain-containing protein n=1 Tax=candidate division WWE3 bacterium RBG_16_37_10 TaxID=1802610 RepID=A0A1F4UZV6_UNCKA|nr:MAG: hypothetical protein ACD_22C00256G0007 [uncultured bacterium]OGC49733.1 MAG: hypothetical protein A2W32_05320 [candidate division WWE3 bacterium RBG_16_37_10]
MPDENQKFTKKQHYIPRFYLRKFSQNDETLNVYDRKKGKNGEFRKDQSINEIGHENNFYTYTDIGGERKNLEDVFGQFESSAGKILNKIENKEILTPEDKEYFSVFLSLLYLRTPTSKKYMNKGTEQLYKETMRMELATTPKEKFREFYEKKFGKGISDEKLEDLIDFGVNEKRSEIKVDIPNSYWIKQMLQLSMDITPVFNMLNWRVFFSEQKHAFIASDNPFLLITTEKPDPFWGVGLLTQGALKVVPLTSNICLIMDEPDENPTISYKETTSKELQRAVNGSLTKKCDRCIFSASMGQLEKLVKEHKPYNRGDHSK